MHWKIDEVRAIVASDGPAAVEAAIGVLERDLAAVPTDAGQRADWSTALDDRLRRLAVKISPSMSLEQGDEWRKVMVDALSDLPALVSLTAAKRAIHRPMQFMNEVEPVIRELAAEIEDRRRKGLWRLRQLQAELAAASQPRLTAPAGWEGGQTAPLSADEIRRTPAYVLRMGLSAGFLTEADIEAAGVRLTDEDLQAA